MLQNMLWNGVGLQVCTIMTCSAFSTALRKRLCSLSRWVATALRMILRRIFSLGLSPVNSVGELSDTSERLGENGLSVAKFP